VKNDVKTDVKIDTAQLVFERAGDFAAARLKDPLTLQARARAAAL
jgi:hypothetical protein